MSSDDLSDVIKGTPFYFDVEQIAERLDNLQEYRNAQPCDCGSPDCESNQESDEEDLPEFSLEDMISNAVNAGLESAMNKLMKKYTLTEKVKPEKVGKPAKVVVEQSE